MCNSFKQNYNFVHLRFPLTIAYNVVKIQHLVNVDKTQFIINK
jgi:hypothetical protein